MFNGIKIAIVVSTFNESITEKLLEGAYDTLIESGVDAEQIKVVKVPGAIEIPLVTQLLAKTNEYQAIICLGAIIQGDTDHHLYVAQQVSVGIQQIMLETNTPVIFGILTTHNSQQAKDRVTGSGHKGKEAAAAAIEMINVVRALSP